MARSSAPGEIGAAASVWVLTRSGYREAAKGSNGWLCFVGRGWSGPIVIGSPQERSLHPDVFDPKLRAPHCLNPMAVESVWPWQVGRTRLVLAGTPAERVDAELHKDIDAGRLKVPAAGAMAYMTSPHQDLGQRFGHWRPHVMIYLAGLSNEAWGIRGFTHDFPFVAEAGSPWAVAVVPMRQFSDGSYAEERVSGRHEP